MFWTQRTQLVINMSTYRKSYSGTWRDMTPAVRFFENCEPAAFYHTMPYSVNKPKISFCCLVNLSFSVEWNCRTKVENDHVFCVNLTSEMLLCIVIRLFFKSNKNRINGNETKSTVAHFFVSDAIATFYYYCSKAINW